MSYAIRDKSGRFKSGKTKIKVKPKKDPFVETTNDRLKILEELYNSAIQRVALLEKDAISQLKNLDDLANHVETLQQDVKKLRASQLPVPPAVIPVPNTPMAPLVPDQPWFPSRPYDDFKPTMPKPPEIWCRNNGDGDSISSMAGYGINNPTMSACNEVPVETPAFQQSCCNTPVPVTPLMNECPAIPNEAILRMPQPVNEPTPAAIGETNRRPYGQW